MVGLARNMGYNGASATPNKWNGVFFKKINFVPHGGEIVPGEDFFICCGSIKDLEKAKFSANS